MGWRTDHAYEKMREADYRRWRRSLSWTEYARFQLDRFGAMLAGAGIMCAVFAGLWWLGVL